MHRFRDIGKKLQGVTVGHLTSRIRCIVMFHLTDLEIGCWTVETEKQTHTI